MHVILLIREFITIMIKFIERDISGKKVLVLFVLTNIVYAFMLIVTIPKTMELSNGMKLLDMMPAGYDVNYVSELFNLLGEYGRGVYLTNQIPVDMIYPALFGLTYCLLLAYLLKKINKFTIPFRYLCLLPVIAGIADYCENFGIITMLINYPDLTAFTANATNLFSVVKSISTSIFFVVLIMVLIALGFKTLSANKASVSK